MNRADHARIVQTLKAAKRYLWNGKSFNSADNKYICHAILAVRGATDNDKKLTRSVVMNRLGMCDFSTRRPFENRTVTCWLKEVAKIDSSLLTTENVQAYRHRWIDELIKEFSA